MFCRNYGFQPVKSGDICTVICFPSNDTSCCIERVEELKSLGIDILYSFGNTVLSRGIRIIGKGHAAIVVLAHHVDHGIVALKIRRTDSKRFSMEWEAKIISKVLGSGYTPKIYNYSNNFLARDFIDGCTFEELLYTYSSKDEMVKALKSLVEAAFAMDLAGVDLVEISRPLKQVIYYCCNSLKPFFIDFESAKMTPNPLNVTKVIGFIVSGVIGNKQVKDIIGLDEQRSRKLIELAKRYKASIDIDKKRQVFTDIVKLLLEPL